MQIETILKAEEEAKKFLKRVQLVRIDVKERVGGYSNGTFIYGNRNTGALRRQSMELTNALADLRKS